MSNELVPGKPYSFACSHSYNWQSLWLHQNRRVHFFFTLIFSPKLFVHFCELCTLWPNHKLHLAHTMFTGRGTLYLLISFRLLLIGWLISPQVLISLMLLPENACSSCWLLQPALAKCSEPSMAGGSAHGEETAIWEFPPFYYSFVRYSWKNTCSRNMGHTLKEV